MNNSVPEYNPNSIAEKNGNFMGLPFDYNSANLIILPIPWEVTVSYGAGTANGPERILDASLQIDLFDFDHPDGWKQGIFMVEIPQDMITKNNYYRQEAAKIIERQSVGKSLTDSPNLTSILAAIN